MSWSDVYIGIPYADHGRDRTGCDCWGLARLVYQDQLRISLPSCASDYASAAEMRGVSDILAQRHHGPWQPVEDVRPFDLLLFRLGTYESHVGIAVSHRTMLHMALNDQARIESQTGPRWSHRFVCAYRYVQTPLNARPKVAA